MKFWISKKKQKKTTNQSRTWKFQFQMKENETSWPKNTAFRQALKSKRERPKLTSKIIILLTEKTLSFGFHKRMYRQVNWDSKLPSKLHAPTTTYEGGRADPLKRNEPSPITKELAKVVCQFLRYLLNAKFCSKLNLFVKLFQIGAVQRLVGSNWDREQYRHTYMTRDPVVL